MHKRINNKKHIYTAIVEDYDIASAYNPHTKSYIYKPYIIIKDLRDVNYKLVAKRACFKFKKQTQVKGLIVPNNKLRLSAHFDPEKQRLISITDLEILNQDHYLELPPNQYQITGLIMTLNFIKFKTQKHKLDPFRVNEFNKWLKQNLQFKDKLDFTTHVLKPEYQAARPKVLMHLNPEKAW